MFKFNFGNENEEPDEEAKPNSNINWYKCSELRITPALKERLTSIEDKSLIKLNYDNDITLTCLSPAHVIENLNKKQTNCDTMDMLEADKNHSDLVPGKYEGGLKIWECTRDLVNYLVGSKEEFNGSKLLDLGCGSGILGLIGLLKGALVTFQDYNREVLELVTIPNVYLNFKNVEICGEIKFFSGDWASFLEKMLHNNESEIREPSTKRIKATDVCEKFDYILTSETIYNADNYEKICDIIKNLLKRSGKCYVAAKKCYFGVGGSINGFEECLRKKKMFNIETCWSSNNGTKFLPCFGHHKVLLYIFLLFLL